MNRMIFTHVEAWVKKHGGNCKDVAFDCVNVRSVLEAESDTIYSQTLKKIRPHGMLYLKIII